MEGLLRWLHLIYWFSTGSVEKSVEKPSTRLVCCVVSCGKNKDKPLSINTTGSFQHQPAVFNDECQLGVVSQNPDEKGLRL